MTLSAPFPWFGGKRQVADEVWSAFGDVVNYVEPFAGSLAVLQRQGWVYLQLLASPGRSPDRRDPLGRLASE